jgi:hypothetical protein
MEIVHVPPATTELLQVLLSRKFELATMLVIDSVAVPVFVKVTFFTALVVPHTTLPKLTVVADSETVCACMFVLSSAMIGSKRTSPKRDFRQSAERWDMSIPIFEIEF